MGLPPLLRRGGGGHALDNNPNAVAHYNYPHGHIVILQQLEPKSIPHELGHAADAMLGEAFQTEFAAYFAQYLELGWHRIKAPAAVRADWATMSRYRSNTLSASAESAVRRARTQLTQHGWLPSEYAGTSAQEFWAECFAYAFVPQAFSASSPDSKPNLPRHYLPVVDAIRRAFTKGRRPEEIRQILREAWVGM